jgi:hypothetical protein
MLIHFDPLIEELRNQGLINLTQRLEWDVYLTDVNEVKCDAFRNVMPLSSEDRYKVLTHPMPRFMWRATGMNGDEPVVDMLFDATDIEQGAFLVRIIEYDESFAAVVRSVAQDPSFQDKFKSSSAGQILRWFAN